MVIDLFGNFFRNLQIPIIVCAFHKELPVVFSNASAKILFSNTLDERKINVDQGAHSFKDIVHFKNEDSIDELYPYLRMKGVIDNHSATLLTSKNTWIRTQLNANIIHMDGAAYAVFYFNTLQADKSTASPGTDIMEQVLNASYHDELGVDKIIENILDIVGNSTLTSRIFIFEDIPNNMVKNTYEWCAGGVSANMANMQNLSKDDFCYDVLLDSDGLSICDDTQKLAEKEKSFLYGKQGIDSIAIMPLFHLSRSIGYVGFANCAHVRNWSQNEIRLLQNVAGVLSSLINKRNTEYEARVSNEILQTISDNTHSIVYVNDIETCEVKFVSKAFATALGIPAEDIIGKPCWQVLRTGKTGPCEFCPMSKLLDSNGHKISDSCTWEYQTPDTNRWYLSKDSIFDWVDGRPVHIGNSVDITTQKQSEEQLKHFAATDAMTQTYNREWGYKLFREIFERGAHIRGQNSLCFIDIDELKAVNDTFGHNIGDEVIIEIASIINSCIRRNDIFCRWGGDEFILLLNCNVSDSIKIMKKIDEKLALFNQTQHKPYQLNISYGITGFAPNGADTLDQIIRRADRLMYRDKTSK